MKLCDLPSAALLLVLGSFFTSPAQSSGERDAFARQAAIRAQGTSGSSPEVEELKRSATRRIQGGDLKSAEGDLRKAVALAPNDVAALTLLGGVLSTQHRLEESSSHAEYGKVLLQPWASGEIPGREVKAERLLRRATQLDDSLAIAHFELGTLLLRNQRAAEALPHLEKAAKLDAGNAQAHFVLARAYRALDRTQDAEREMLLFQNLQLEPAAPGKESAPPRSR
jgi:Flp pilus assembly protein TadD